MDAQSNSPNETSDRYLLGLDDCALKVDRFSTGATVYTNGVACTQDSEPGGWTKYVATSDQLILENDDAQFWFTSGGDLELRRRDGDLVWHVDVTGATRVVHQTDGNLVIYGSSGALWASGTTGTSATPTMQLVGCQMRLVTAAGSAIYQRGFTDCNQSTRTFDNYTYKADGHLRLLQTKDSYLVFQKDGNLCLNTQGGTALWCSGTSGSGKYLQFTMDEKIYIKNSAGTVIYTYIAYPTPYYNVEKIGLSDGCKLTIQGYSGNVVKTMNADCDVAKYTFEDSDGNDVFGSNVTTTMTATAGSPNKTTTTTKVGLVIFGNDTELLSLTAYQTSNNTNKETYGSVTVFGASMSIGFSLSKSETLFEKTYPVGGVPVVVKAGFSGSLSLTASVDSQLQYKVTPALGIYANVSAGVGVSGTVAGLKAGASAGFKGTLALLELSFPVTMTVSSTFTVKGEMTLKMLSGALSLYAEAFVEVAGIKAAVSWTYKLISWTGIESTSTLFSATGKSF